MSLKSTRGIIFRSIKYSESSLILDIYTLDFGLKSLIVSGVRKSRTKNSASLLQILNVIEFTFYQGEAEKLSRIKEYNIYHKYANLTYEVIRTSVGIFMLELCRNSIREREENKMLYDFIENNLIQLDTIDYFSLGAFYPAFAINLTEQLGFFPMQNITSQSPIFDLQNGRFVPSQESSKYTMTASQSELLIQLISDPLTAKITKVEREELIDNILLYYALHIPDFKNIKSLDVLREVMK